MRFETAQSKRPSGRDLVSSKDGHNRPDLPRRDRRAPDKAGDKDKAQCTPTAEELELIKKHMARLAERPPVAPRLKVDAGKISLDHPDPTLAQIYLAEALGTADSDVTNGLINQLVKAAAQDGEINEARLNFLLGFIKSNRPRDENEAMLTAQMATIHLAAMDCAGRLGQATLTPHFDSISGALNKFARTFALQVEALKRYKSGADDRVLLQQNVSVTEGGQAIVGNVNQTPRERSEGASRQSTPSVTGAPAAEVHINGAQVRRQVIRPRRTNEEQSSA